MHCRTCRIGGPDQHVRRLVVSNPSKDEQGESKPLAPQEIKTLKLSETARKNLHLVSKSIKPQTYWRTIQIPGVITDRPGFSDRGVTSPAVGTVAEVHAFPGDTVKPGEKLFTLRLFSEYLQNTQAELFRATKELQLIAENRARLDSGVQSGAIPAAKIIELENQAKRQATAIQGFRQDLLTRGLTPPQIDAVADGRFVSTIEVVALDAVQPPRSLHRRKCIQERIDVTCQGRREQLADSS